MELLKEKIKKADYSTIYRPDINRIKIAKDRQNKLFKNEKPDKPPVIISAGLTPMQEELLPNPNFDEAFYDKDLMIAQQFRGFLGTQNSKCDAVPSMRVNFGTGILLACLGLEQDIFPDKMPWLQRHLTKEEASKLTIDDIKIQGSFEKGLEYIKYFREATNDEVPVYCMDTQGPFDLAHLLLGDDIFIQLYDDPKYMHHIMEICLELGIKTHTWMKELSGEPMDKMYHGSAYYSENMGIRICEDTTVLINSNHIDEFAMPYTKRLAQHFGGGWVHYCGRNDYLTKAICDIDEIKGINFGHIPGKVNDVNMDRFLDTMDICEKTRTVFMGSWPIYENESGKEYLDRIYELAKKGCILPNVDDALNSDDFNSSNEVLDYWYGK